MIDAGDDEDQKGDRDEQGDILLVDGRRRMRSDVGREMDLPERGQDVAAVLRILVVVFGHDGRQLSFEIEEGRPIPAKGWAAMIRKVYEVDPMICPECGSEMMVVAFITDYQALDRIIDHLKLTFAAEKPSPSHVFELVALMAAEERQEYF